MSLFNRRRSISPCRLAVIIATIACAAWNALGADKQFEPVGIGGGGGIFWPARSPHDSNLIFCTSDMSGVYRSTDAGKNWTMLPHGQLAQTYACPIVFSPTDANVCYAVPGPWGTQRLMVSSDKGATWKPLTPEMPWSESGQVNQIAISPDGKVMLIAADKATFRTEDDGKTWTKVEGIEDKVLGFVLPPPSPNVAGMSAWCAGTSGGVLLSSDYGKKWTLRWKPEEKMVAFCGGWKKDAVNVALYASVPTRVKDGKFAGGIYRSTDRGANWAPAMGEGINTSIREGASGAGATASGVASAPASSSRPAARLTAEYNFLAMAQNQTDTLYTYCYGNGDKPPHHSTVYRSDNGGKTWQAVLFGPRDMEGQNVELGWRSIDENWMSETSRILTFAVNPANSDQLGFTNYMEIYLSDNGGKSWRQAYSRCAQGQPGPGKAWSGIGLEMTTTWHFDFDPHDANRCYISYTDICFARSEDRGTSWHYSVEGLPRTWKNTCYDIAFDPDAPGVVYGAFAYEHDIPSWKMAGSLYGDGGVAISRDYGKTWKLLRNGLPTLGPCTAVVVDAKSPKDNRTLYCAMWGTCVYKSTDGGSSWTLKANGLKADKNSHFSDLKLHKDGSLLCLATANRKDRESLAPGGVFRSTDGGENWADLTEKLDLRHPYGFDVDPSDSNVIYVGNCAIPRLHDPAGLYKTADGGASWKRLDVPWPKGEVNYVHVYFPSVDPYNPKRVWANAGTHGFMVTTDAGQSWKEVKGVPFKGISRVSVDPKDHETIWVTTFGGGVWRGPAMGTQ